MWRKPVSLTKRETPDMTEDRKLLTEFQPGRGYSKEDWDEVSDNPEWTDEEMRQARPFANVFTQLAERLRRRRSRPSEKPTSNA
jgi:hypothetical protein